MDFPSNSRFIIIRIQLFTCCLYGELVRQMAIFVSVGHVWTIFRGENVCTPPHNSPEPATTFFLFFISIWLYTQFPIQQYWQWYRDVYFLCANFSATVDAIILDSSTVCQISVVYVYYLPFAVSFCTCHQFAWYEIFHVMWASTSWRKNGWKAECGDPSFNYRQR